MLRMPVRETVKMRAVGGRRDIPGRVRPFESCSALPANSVLSLRRLVRPPGGMTERSKVTVLKTVEPVSRFRGFKSHSLRPRVQNAEVSTHPRRVRPEPLFALGAISQYVGAAIAVLLFESMPARSVAFLRVLGAAGIIVVARRSWSRSWTRERLKRAALFGVVLALMNLAFYLAIDRLPLGNAVAIEFLGPIVVAALGTATLRGTLALLLGAGGVVVLAGVTPEVDPLGVAFALMAAALWAGYIVLGQRVAMSGAGVDGLGVGMAVGALAIAPVGLPGMSVVIDRPGLVLAAVLTGLFSSAIPYGIDQVVLARIPRSRFALLQSMMPAVATIVGLVALAQRPAVSELLGIAMVAAGILLAPE